MNDAPNGVRTLRPDQITKAWIEDHSDEVWLPVDPLIKLWGPSILKALQKGRLTAYTFGDDPRPALRYNDFLDWMAATPGRLERLQRYARRN